MLRARPSNEVRASAERIGLLQPLAGFYSASGSVRRPAAIDAMRARFLSVQTSRGELLGQKKGLPKCENNKASGMQGTSSK